jgi:ATP-dependent helicase YprA (DUF1998 family)/phage repressor protein C with HTH and peptisase S24 domain
MALNPVVYTEKVVRSFLRYQLTAYPFADERLHGQMRTLLSLDKTRESPLLKGPYISLSRSFRQGASVDELVTEGIFHSHMRQRIPAAITHVYGHQEEAIRSINSGQTTLISTGTGSGKTECFLYPIVSHCLDLKDQGAEPGICAVLVYPMNALAEDQLERLRGLLAGTGISFGMYVGKTPEEESSVAGIRLPAGSSRADYEARLAEVRRENRSESVYPAEEVCSRKMMRTPGSQPRILLTNVNQLELLLTRQRDVELFSGARLDYLVFDEAHTYTGARGAETACLIRRLRSFCDRDAMQTVCVATSATIVDEENPDAALEFASRFFGVPAPDVTTVGESYEPEIWNTTRTIPPVPGKDPAELLQACTQAVDAEDEPDQAVQMAFLDLAGEDLSTQEYPEALHEAMLHNELVYQLNEALVTPRELHELPEEIEEKIGRPVSEAEILAWLTLGAAARKGGRPLLRPVIHGFIRGISGAVVSFSDGSSGPKLWLAAEDEIESSGEESETAHFNVTTCTTCGQHYYISFLKDFEFVGKAPDGGEATGSSSFWEPLEEALGGCRVVLTDRIVGGSDDEEIEDHHRTATLHFCRHCGAAHPEKTSRCLHCSAQDESVALHALRQKSDNPGHLTSCISCGANGRRMGSRYREPARPVRATNVSDVHVLAQDMVHHSERPRLLVFCDNRQDAAFQAGWMKDHARRFRLRALMADGMKKGPVSIGDLTHHLDDILNKNDSLSKAMVPEVWQVVRKEGSGGRHDQERRKFLRIQVLREVTLSSRQAIGLEPWGRMKVEYEGLDSSLQWIQDNSNTLGLPAEELCEGVTSLLDYLRRRRVLHDPDRGIFTKYWLDGDLEVQQGYLPQMGNPVGTKLQRTPEENENPKAHALIAQWYSGGGDTTIRQIVKKWGVAANDVEPFLDGLFECLKSQGFLKPVRLRGSKGRPLPHVSEVYQLDADRIRLRENHGLWRCRKCRRHSTRRTPQELCPAWRCDGAIEFVREDPDSYNLQLLDENYSMLRPEEHTAMVPHDERERLENLFKGDSEAVNCFVCTPTLEMGVDIGKLDAILMRNVPPLPANYWQRAGRAGRRHRMAVNLTYSRPVSHDRAYFTDPMKLLTGRIDPPSFNLRNELLVAKHVHACVLTRLHQYSRDPSRTDSERDKIKDVLDNCVPRRVSHYLFEMGSVRTIPLDLSPLTSLIESNIDDLLQYVENAFQQGWPQEDLEVASAEILRAHIADSASGLEDVVARLRRRLRWAMSQISRLNVLREKQGDLEPADDSLFKRCDRLLKRLKGTARRTRKEAEGYDDVNTFGILAAEGFLPGYGLEIGSILGSAEIPFWRSGAMDFSLPRAPSVALREYVPGNLIYANGNRFVARRFHRDVDEDRVEMPVFEVSTEHLAVKETNVTASASTLGTEILRTIAVCDVDLAHQSHISDEEELRFQMGVSICGLERDQHNGGIAFQWGTQPLQLRKGVGFRLVNVGSSAAIERASRYGYPVCTVCGQSTSPLSSQKQRDHFSESHEERCGRKIEPVGFYADVTAVALSLPACESQSVAFSVLESLRMAATRVLDMHLDDLQILVIGYVDREDVDAVLWDPMPGGSGLLDQICHRFDEIAKIAQEIVEDCPSACESSCIDCLQTFRNAYYHKHLDRKLVLEKLQEWGNHLAHSHDIPPKQPSQEPSEGSHPVNEYERRLRHLLLAAGFAEGVRGEGLKLDRAIGTTTPDVIYRADHHDDDEGVCIYMDGLSGHIHGNPETASKDREIRTWLRNNGYDVIEIAGSDLSDPGAMRRHFRKLAGYLRADDLKSSIQSSQDWFHDAAIAGEDTPQFIPRIVQPTDEERYQSCVPLISLQVAAGQFGGPQVVEENEYEWVKVESARTAIGQGMFVAQVTGRSMEPEIPDGSYCLFASPVTGSRQGKTVLVKLRDELDPETDERFTIKRYESETGESEDGTWRHVKITLKPNNPDYSAIELTVDDEGEFSVIAEFREVLG